MMPTGMGACLVIILFVGLCYGKFNAASYPFSKQLLPEYTVYWRMHSDIIHLALRVETLGWVGFGITECSSGSMPGSDIVIGTVIDGVGNITDRWTYDFVVPSIDECQDWMLVSAEETDGYTILEIIRKLDTNDTQDRVIMHGANRIVAAYGGSDVLQYHSQNRISTEIIFYGGENPPQLPPDIQTMDILMGDLWIPNEETVYACVAFALPSDKKYHIIQIDPIIQESNNLHVHHFLSNACPNIPNGALEKYNKSALCPPEESGYDQCAGLLSAWTLGGGSTYFPPEAGMPIGQDGAQIGLLQIHYNNPASSDNSGFRIYYTSNLRRYDAGAVMLGDPFVAMAGRLTIPPNAITEFETECPSECTAKLPREIYLVLSGPHMHETGYEFWTTQWRDGVQINEFGRIEFWSFDHQHTTAINITLKPGDRLNTHCVYNNLGNNNVTNFGFRSVDEMCSHTLLYYPKIVAPIIGRFDYCGYGGPNHTVCGNENRSAFLEYNNPTLTDPPVVFCLIKGKITRLFGSNQNKTCPIPFTDNDSSASSIAFTSLFFVLLSLL